jgi:hypothetical protein
LLIAGIDFFEAPSKIEGSPYWVDLWGCVNGYRIGIQVKPDSFSSASVSIYTGKAKSSMKLGQKRFLEDYGGRVFVTNLTKGCPPPHVEAEIIIEIERLIELEHGNLCDE